MIDLEMWGCWSTKRKAWMRAAHGTLFATTSQYHAEAQATDADKAQRHEEDKAGWVAARFGPGGMPGGEGDR